MKNKKVKQPYIRLKGSLGKKIIEQQNKIDKLHLELKIFLKSKGIKKFILLFPKKNSLRQLSNCDYFWAVGATECFQRQLLNK